MIVPKRLVYSERPSCSEKKISVTSQQCVLPLSAAVGKSRKSGSGKSGSAKWYLFPGISIFESSAMG